MKLSEFIAQAQSIASRTHVPDPEIVLYDRFGERTLKLDPEADTWDFEMTHGYNEIVLEFD